MLTSGERLGKKSAWNNLLRAPHAARAMQYNSPTEF